MSIDTPTVLATQPVMQPATLALAQSATLGEGLQWHAGSGRWWWTDIEASTLNAWTPGEANTLVVKLPDRLGSFAHTRSGRMLLGLAKRLCMASLVDKQASGGASASLQPLTPVDAAEPRTRINDGRTDRSGNFVFGTMNEVGEQRAIGSFYQYSVRHGLRRLALPAVSIANSICFSPDGGTMYFCDTFSQAIMQCDYDADGAQVANQRLFARITPEHAWPDGAVIAADGSLWNAQWGAGRVVQYSPEGQAMRVVTMPAAHTTCPAFGGEHYNQLMVTSARQKLSREALEAQPLSGSLFGLATPEFRGLPDALFDDRPIA